ncbi:MAG: DUF1003 domain-containing protein [Myxococcota bacterium]
MSSTPEGGEARRACALCDRVVERRELVRTDSLRSQEAEHIARGHPDRWPGSGYLCRTCLKRERVQFVLDRLEQERGELSGVEADVARRAGEHVAIAENLEREFARQATRGQRIADSVAAIGGSWPFVIGFLIALGLWVALNVALASRAFDPQPFILLNLVLSCLAALQAPIIMMSQNRLSARDRIEADLDFRVNLKAELEIASLHEKIDHLLHGQFERMVELQEVQLELLSDLAEERAQR